MMYLLSLFADFERKTIAQRIKDNMHHLAKSGRWLGGTTPIGYKSVEIKGGISESGKQRKAFRLDIVHEQAEMVRTLFRKYLELGSLTGVDNYCLENGIKTRQGKTYSRNTLKPIFTNPVYAAADSDTLAYLRSLGAEIYADEAQFDGEHGLIAYNKTDQSKPGAHKVNDISDWIISVGKHNFHLSRIKMI
jgi:site-specific DNA recombinase